MTNPLPIYWIGTPASMQDVSPTAPESGDRSYIGGQIEGANTIRALLTVAGQQMELGSEWSDFATLVADLEAPVGSLDGRRLFATEVLQVRGVPGRSCRGMKAYLRADRSGPMGMRLAVNHLVSRFPDRHARRSIIGELVRRDEVHDTKHIGLSASKAHDGKLRLALETYHDDREMPDPDALSSRAADLSLGRIDEGLVRSIAAIAKAQGFEIGHLSRDLYPEDATTSMTVSSYLANENGRPDPDGEALASRLCDLVGKMEGKSKRIRICNSTINRILGMDLSPRAGRWPPARAIHDSITFKIPDDASKPISVNLMAIHPAIRTEF